MRILSHKGSGKKKFVTRPLRKFFSITKGKGDSGRVVFTTPYKSTAEAKFIQIQQSSPATTGTRITLSRDLKIAYPAKES